MGIIINHKSHYYKRLPFWILGIIFLSLSPFIIGLSAAWLTEQLTGESCHEGNCVWGVIPWFGLYTLPIGVIGFLIFIVIIIIDSIRLSNKNKSN